MDYSVKAIRQDFKSKGVFYTPPELSEFMKSLLPAGVKEVYDPTCGAGNLLSVFSDDVQKFGQDINGEQVEYAKRRLVNFVGESGDTLQAPAFWGRKFEGIVSNYPFSIKWTPKSDERFSEVPVLPPPSKADFAFILHILHYLSDTGVAAVMGFPGILYRGGREQVLRKWLCEKNYIEKIISIPGKKFTDTSISTVVLVFRKNKETRDIVFQDIENELERTVNPEEIEQNDFDLSVSRYIQKKETKVATNPLKLKSDARRNACEMLRANIQIEKVVCELEGWDFKEFIKELQAVLNEFSGQEAKDKERSKGDTNESNC